MFDWKIIISAIVVLTLVVAYLSGNPSVSGFFETLNNRVTSLSGGTVSHNVPFSLATDKYTDVDFSASRPVNFTITGDTVAVMGTGTLRTNKTLTIYGFTGTGSVKGSELVLDGKISKIQLPDVTVAVQETIQLNSTFTTLQAEGLDVKTIAISNATGVLAVKGTSTQFSGDITITSPVGNYVFGGNFSLSGIAGKISIPSAGISIS